MENEFVNDALKTLSNPSSQFFKQIIEALYKSGHLLHLDRDTLFDNSRSASMCYNSYYISHIYKFFQERCIININWKSMKTISIVSGPINSSEEEFNNQNSKMYFQNEGYIYRTNIEMDFLVDGL